MRAVNLLPPEAARGASSRLRSLPWLVSGVFAAACLLLAGTWLQADRTVDAKRRELNDMQAALAASKARERPRDRRGERAHAEGERLRDAVANALYHRVAWDSMLARIPRALPRDVWLSELRTESPNPAAPSADPTAAGAGGAPVAAAPPRGIELTGYAYSYKGLSRLLAQLSRVPALDNLELRSSTKTVRAGQTQVQFVISGDVIPGRTA